MMWLSSEDQASFSHCVGRPLVRVQDRGLINRMLTNPATRRIPYVW